MDKTDLTEYADYLLRTAMHRLQNISDAEDLVQETLMAALLVMEKGKVVDNPKNWLVTVLNKQTYGLPRPAPNMS
ncbi:DNA-directed RNA polymerase specialized sigma24 family protein [Anaerotaenia torta]|uniref:RNA polymerase sigma factor n=1 Tax=Anaerotaenia torta TaxID=433293 RepID=UPI003D19236A